MFTSFRYSFNRLEFKSVFKITNVLSKRDPVPRKRDPVPRKRDPVPSKRDPVPPKRDPTRT